MWCLTRLLENAWIHLLLNSWTCIMGIRNIYLDFRRSVQLGLKLKDYPISKVYKIDIKLELEHVWQKFKTQLRKVLLQLMIKLLENMWWRNSISIMELKKCPGLIYITYIWLSCTMSLSITSVSVILYLSYYIINGLICYVVCGKIA